MRQQDWVILYKHLHAGGKIANVIYDESRSINDQRYVELMLDSDTFISIKIID